jgi:haloalkane dehalogenase
VNFVTSFLERLQVEKVHLLLHDWGGLIGLEWARLNPEMVLSLVVTDTVYCADYEWNGMAQKLQDVEHGEFAIEKMDDKTTWSQTMKQLIPRIKPEVLKDFYRIYETDESRKVALELYQSGDLTRLTNHKGELRRLNKPATIIWGEKDPFVSKEYAYKLHNEELPNASVNIVPGAGHFIHIESADAVSQIVKDHFDRLKRTDM